MSGDTANSEKTHALYLITLVIYVLIRAKYAFSVGWEPEHDTLAQYSEFVYAYASWHSGEFPLWNSYLYGGQEFYLLLNHGLLLNPVAWIWIVIGRISGLLPSHAFALSHMTDIIFFAAGGALLAYEVYRNRYSSACTFTLLLFCGQVLYWTQQVYGLIVIIYLPWILYSLLRYLRHQTVARAIMVAGWTGIGCNVYYPVYLATFMVMAAPVALTIFRRNLPDISIRKLIFHVAATLPLFILLIVPTLLIYNEITTSNSTFMRDVTAQNYWISYDHFLRNLLTTLKETASVREGFGESFPLIGIGGMLLVACGFANRDRMFYFWLIMLGVMTIFYLPTRAAYVLGSYTVPFFKVMRTPGFYCGFVTFCLIMLAAHGISVFCPAHRTDPAMPITKIAPADSLTLAVIAAGILFAVLLPYKYFPFTVAVVVLTVCNRWLCLFGHNRHRQYCLPALYIILLASCVYSALNVNEQRLDMRFPDSTIPLDHDFKFSLDRPADYQFYASSGNTSGPFIFYNIGARTDGPYFFGDGKRELFVDRKYADALETPGFQDLMKHKFTVATNYVLGNRITDYRPLTGKSVRISLNESKSAEEVFSNSVVVLADDRLVRKKDLRTEPANGTVPAIDAVAHMKLRVINKTANTLTVEVTMYNDGFLVYTDLYRDDFVATVDGKPVPLLKAMGLFKAVELAPGTTIVTFEFKPFYRYILTGYLLACGFFYLFAACDIFSPVKIKVPGREY